MTVIINSNNKLVSSGKVRISYKPITEIISSTNIVQWYDAQDLSGVGIGNSVATWNDRSSSADHLIQATSSSQGILQIDSNGFNYVLFDYSTFTKEMQTTLSRINTNETVIMIVDRSSFVINGGLRTDFSASLDLCSVTNANIQQSITDGITNSGRQVLNGNTLGKIIVSFSRKITGTPTMRLSIGITPVSVPLVNTTFPSASIHRFFRGSAGSAYTVKAYSSITINQYVDDNTLKLMIRSMAFQKGIIV